MRIHPSVPGSLLTTGKRNPKPQTLWGPMGGIYNRGDGGLSRGAPILYLELTLSWSVGGYLYGSSRMAS